MNEKKRLVNVADSHSQLGTGDQSDATVSRHSHRELSGRQPQVDELRSAHQAETGDPGFEGSIERIQKEAMEGQGGSEPHHKVLSGSESSEETDRRA